MKNPSMRYEEELSRRKATGAFGFPESGGARVSGEKGMTAEPLRINLNAGPVAPKHWNVSGSRFQRSSTPWKPMMDAFPEYCDRSRLGQYSIREFEVMRPGVYRGNRVFEATVEKMRQFEANFNPSDRPPLQIDHRLSALDTHGEILDVLTVPANAGEPAKTFVLTIFKGDYCCERVNDGRWHRFSLGFFEKPSATIYELSIVTKQAVPTAKLSEDMATKGKPAPVPSMATLKAELEEYRVEYDRWRKQRELSHQEEKADRAMLREAFGIAPVQASSKRPENTDNSELSTLRKAAGLE